MKNLNHIFIATILLTSLAFTSCEKTIEPPNNECKAIIGDWQWNYSTAGFGHPIKTPQTEGYSQSIIFDNNGKHYLIINEEVRMTNQFIFKKAPSIYETGNDYLIYYQNFKNNQDEVPHSFEFANSKTLVLSEQCYDCYSHVYTRK